MQLIAKVDKEADRNARINRFGKPWTADEIRKTFFPANLIGQSLQYIAEKKDVKMYVSSCNVELKQAIPLTNGIDSVLIDHFDFGNYWLKFNGNTFCTCNILEQKALTKKMGIICTGPVVKTPEPVPEKPKEAPKPSWLKNRKENLPEL